MRIALAILLAATCLAETRYVVQINEDGTETIPPKSIATPHQVQQAEGRATSILEAATNLQSRVSALEEQCARLGTNLVVTSTCYIKSIGGVAYNPDLQHIRIISLELIEDNLEIVGIVTQVPLAPPVLDWRAKLDKSDDWTNVAATVDEIAMPGGLPEPPKDMAWRKAYRFRLPRPDMSSAFFRVIDNSSGASGSGLYWVVFGAIVVEGRVGRTAIVYDDHNTKMTFRGGVLVEDDPL